MALFKIRCKALQWSEQSSAEREDAASSLGVVSSLGCWLGVCRRPGALLARRRGPGGTSGRVPGSEMGWTCLGMGRKRWSAGWALILFPLASPKCFGSFHLRAGAQTGYTAWKTSTGNVVLVTRVWRVCVAVLWNTALLLALNSFCLCFFIKFWLNFFFYFTVRTLRKISLTIHIQCPTSFMVLDVEI